MSTDKYRFNRKLGWSFMLFGLVVVVFSSKIAFPGFELLLGIEAIVGKENVIYLDDGGYMYTNPGAMVR
jgi:sulfur relay (sulfurtransferase) DsrF/TusC family protein